MRPMQRVLVCFALLLAVTGALAQNPQTGLTGVLRLRVQVKANDTARMRGLARKRFFLIPGTLEQNRTLIDAIEREPVATRDCYYKKLGASAALLDWLKEGDCESVYCRSVEKDFIVGPKAVPEFARAFAASQTEFGSEQTAQQWVTTNLAPDMRDGFYRDRQRVIETLLKHLTAYSAMTDRNGTTYFTDLGPGTYVLTNAVPAELGQSLTTWNCEVQVKAGDLATEKPYLISNRKEKSVKCVAVEKPMPVCNTE